MICYASRMEPKTKLPGVSIWLFRFRNIIAIILLFTLPSSFSSASEEWLDLVRVEQGKFSREIIYQHKQDRWFPPVSLTKDSRTDDFTPASIRIAAGRSLVLWKESTGVDASRLVYSIVEIAENGGYKRKSENAVVRTNTPHQSSPTLIRENNDTIWGFWVGFNGKDDDIYYAKFFDGGWSEEKRLYNDENGVPDLQPSARINLNGRLELRWRQFSFEKSNYIDVFSRLESRSGAEPDRWSVPAEYVLNPLEKTPRLPEDFVLPSGVSQPNSASINFSGHPQIVLHWNKLPVAQE